MKIEKRVLRGLTFLILGFLLSVISANAQVMIVNEIMFKPGENLTNPNSHQGLYGGNSREYVELYNSDCAGPKDISGWVIACRTLDQQGGSFVFPAGTVIPPASFLIFGGPNESCNACSVPATYAYPTGSIDLKMNLYVGTPNLCNEAQGWVLSNYDGWLAIYEADGTPHSAVYWSSNASNINSMSDFDWAPCSPGAYSGVALKSIKAIKASHPSVVVYAGDPGAVTKGKTFSRIPDGGTFTLNANPTIGPNRSNRCNDGNCIACGNLSLTPANATCNQPNGTIVAEITDVVTSPPPYSYTLTGPVNQTITTSTNPYTFTGLPPGDYTVSVVDNFSPPNTTTRQTTVGNGGSISTTTAATPSTCGSPDGTATATPSGGTTYTYAWSTSPSQSTQTATGLVPGSYTVTVSSMGCTTTSTVTVTNVGSVTTTTASTPSNCGSPDGTATATPAGGTTYTYAWSTSPAQSTQTATGLVPGSYTVTVSSMGCTTTSTVVVQNVGGPTATGTTTPSYCGQNNGTATITASGGTGSYTYTWNNGVGQSLSNLSPGSYTCTISDGGVCPAVVNLSVTEIAGPVAAISADPTVLQPGGTVNFEYDGTGNPSLFNWDFGDNTVGSGANTSHQYDIDGTFIVLLSVTDAHGCTSSANIQIEVVTINIPNVITPNGDGINDTFVIQGLEAVSGKLLKIYNRWGKKVYENNEYLNDWDAGNLPAGVYFYVFKVPKIDKEFHGTITVFTQL